MSRPEPDIDPEMLRHFEERDVFYMNPIAWVAAMYVIYALIGCAWIFRGMFH